MQNKFKVVDKSGDRDYFTIIPNYVISNASPYELAIYLHMKRVAGETGSCWLSAQTMADKLGCSRNTIAKYRNELLNRGWIEVVGKAGKTKPTDEYRIVDLWGVNHKEYAKKDSSTVEQSQKDSSTGDEIVHHVNLVSSPRVHKEDPIKKNQEEEGEITPSKYSKSFFSGGEAFQEVMKILGESNLPRSAVDTEIKKFVSYWTEPNKSGSKQRWELERTFDVKRRLHTWFGNAAKFNHVNKPKKGITV